MKKIFSSDCEFLDYKSRVSDENEKILVKSPLRYPGGKSRAVFKILQFLPKNIDTLCSPFVGGASIELACMSLLNIKVYGYDAFEPLTNFWQVLLKNKAKLVKSIEEYFPVSREQFYYLQKEYFNMKNEVEMATAFFVLNRASFSGTAFSGGMSPGHPRFTKKTIEQLKIFEAKNLTVEKLDFRESIEKHSNDFLYLDPPYLIDQKLYGNKGDMHRDFAHDELAEILKNRDRWILSYNDSETIKKMYEGYKIVTPEWAYGMNSSKKSREVLILSNDVGKNN